MTTDEKKALSGEIHQKLSELNELLKTAYVANLQVKVDAPIGFPERLFGRGTTPSIQIEIHEVHSTKY